MSSQDLELTIRMRNEWDRRVAHDYRYWMSDGVESDRAMWEVGERDFSLLTSGYDFSRAQEQTVLEIGCGVGRLLRAASKKFHHVIGLDVSEEAIATAGKLLTDIQNLQLITGNGTDLRPVPDGSVDLVVSFAALCSMPIRVVAAYLRECSRVLRVHAEARLQVYLGNSQETFEEDTIAIRSYQRENFHRACEAAGLKLLSSAELELPFEVSDRETGSFAYVVTLQKITSSRRSIDELSEMLLPGGEKRAGNNWQGSETEYFMALARAKQHMEAGQAEAAHQALEFAVRHYGEVDEEVRRIFSELQARMPVNGRTASTTTESQSTEHIDSQIFEQNCAVLRRRFPAVAEALVQPCSQEDIQQLTNSSGVPYLCVRGTPLIHPEKPLRAAESWAQQSVNSPAMKDAETVLIVGFACAYHIEALGKVTAKPIHVCEPDIAILRACLEIRDCRAILESLVSLSVGAEGLRQAMHEGINLSHAALAVYPQTKAIAGAAVDEIRRAMLAPRGLAQLQPRIAVMGPMYGGSLPIANYTSRALAGLRQRGMGYDLSSFYTSFKDLGAFLKNKGRKDALESRYVELLADTVLEGINERPIDILICLAQAPVSPKLLKELRERGVITVMWFVEDCSRFETWKFLAPYFDFMFLIQDGDWIRQVEAAGAGRAIYLPVGCDPDIHRPMFLNEEEKKQWGSDISFVGAGYNNRRHMFAHLANRNFKIWGTEWPDCPPFSKLLQENGRRLTPEEYIKIFNATTVNLNLHSSMERDGVEPFGDFVNPRTFELASSGAFQLVDERAKLPSLFVPGKEAITFSDRREMEAKIDYYLAHPEERATVVRAARERALAEHTYQHRLKAMLEYIYADRFEHLKARQHQGPWAMTLETAKDFPELHERLRKVFERGEDPTLDAVVADITTGKGALSETEQKLLFLHHIRSQITNVRALRGEKDEQ